MKKPEPKFPNEETAKLIGASDAERIAYIRADRWLGYDAAVAVLKELDDLLIHPRVLKMPCRIITADADNGKTALLNRFVNKHSTAAEESDEPYVPVVRFDMPSYPDEGLLYSSVLTGLFVAHRPNAPAEVLRAILVERMTELKVRMLLADEFHNISSHRDKYTREFLIALKGLLNTLCIPLIAAGTQEAVAVIAADRQFPSRFQNLHLPTWRDYPLQGLRLLAGYGAWLPFRKPSELHLPEIAPAFLSRCNLVGDFVAIIKGSAELAIKDGSESITRAHVDKAISERDKRRIK